MTNRLGLNDYRATAPRVGTLVLRVWIIALTIAVGYSLGTLLATIF